MTGFVLFVVACAGVVLPIAAPGQNVEWRVIQPGVEYALIGSLHVVRVDPGHAKVRVALASERGSAAQTAAQWCRTENFAVAINLGMFQDDQRSNVGYLRSGRHTNNSRWNSYRSVLALNPTKPSLAPMLWLDLDQTPKTQVLSQYDIVVQNLRLIAGRRKNVWSATEKKWSEAAVAVDSKGRLLFLFSRAPHSMPEFNQLVLSLPLDIKQAMHVEGGPEASLSIHVAGFDLDLCGSYETGFLPDDSNQRQWPIPNVLGVAAESRPSRPQ
jgi:hypothetical protein